MVSSRKRCYKLWKKLGSGRISAGGKIVWLTDNEKLLLQLQHSKLRFIEIVEEEKLKEYKKYMHQTVDPKKGY